MKPLHAGQRSTAPRGVAIVALEDGNSGSLEAGPITRRILESWVLR